MSSRRGQEHRDVPLAQANGAVQTALNVLTLQSERSTVLECYEQTDQNLVRPIYLERVHSGASPLAIMP